MNDIPIIIFTHKRALQLDSLISSSIKNFLNLKYPINIIYHYNEHHHKSYQLLFNKYGSKVKIFYRKKNNNDFKYHYFLRPLNLLWYWKFKWIRDYFDNFKFLFEDILSNLDTNNVLLSTDDQVFYKKTLIPPKALDLIYNDPSKYSFRLTSNIDFSPDDIIKNYDYKLIHNDYGKNFMMWDHKDINNKNFWKYNFNVDGTVYDRRSLLNLIKPFIYNMPTTLEGIGLLESRIRGYYRLCLGTVSRSFIGVQASNIQTVSNTPSSNFDLNTMMELYLDNFQISYEHYDINEKKYIFIPNRIPLIKDDNIFYLNENGNFE